MTALQENGFDTPDRGEPYFRKLFRDNSRLGVFVARLLAHSTRSRKAPVYWRLGMQSGGYSIWLYIHRTSKDTLHAVLRDHVIPKLRFETNRLAALRAEAGDSPAPSQRRAIDTQEAFLDELRDLRDELQRVAPLWDPDLDDGVVINASFLHRLFAHTRSWQQECESHWKKLCAGDYDWAHLAMRLWPERVVPKCTEDRSLAIAHRLEETFWFQDEADKWQPRAVSDDQIASLVQERSSAAVKDALVQLASAAVVAPARKTKSRKPRAAQRRAPKPPPSSAQLSLLAPATSTTIDKATLDALRAALHGFPDGAARAELLAASGIDEAAWKSAIDSLVDSGEVQRSGQARGTRYRLATTPPAGAR